MSSFHLGEEEALYRQRRAGARWGSVPPFWADNLRVGLPDTFHLGLLLGLVFSSLVLMISHRDRRMKGEMARIGDLEPSRWDEAGVTMDRTRSVDEKNDPL
jgi:hypothetical protein